MKTKFQMDNIVRIGDCNKREIYCWAILLRMQPFIYDKKEHGCIIIQVRDNLLEFTETLLRKWRFVGLKEVSRKRKEYKVSKDGGGYKLPDAWEIVLKKIGALEAIEEDD